MQSANSFNPLKPVLPLPQFLDLGMQPLRSNERLLAYKA